MPESGVPGMPMKNDLSDIDAVINLIAPIISHEVRNPLAIIGNSSYFIKTKLGKDGASDPKIEKHIGIIEIELAHANDVFEKILGYARMPEAKSKPADLSALVRAAVASFKNVAVPAAKAAPSVAADPELAVRSLRCVVENAVQAVGGVESADARGRVRVSVSSAKGLATVLVEDDGPGIPPEAQRRLFLPFNTTKPRGIGMGLAYARKAIERQGGKIEARKAAAGAAFAVSLPLSRG